MSRRPRPRSSSHTALALLRLLFLYAAFCYLLLEIGFASRTLSEALPFLNSSPPASPQSAYPLHLAGVNVALEQYTETAQRQAALAKLAGAGFGWVRQRVDWRLLEPLPGRYLWAQMDQIVAGVAETGLEIVAVLDGSPVWARAAQDRPPTNNPFAPPANSADFARFAAAFATRYGEEIRFYQLWNEPNIAPHWGNRLVEPVAYARLLAAVSPAIRAADKDAVILLAALAPTADRGHTAIDEAYYLQRLYAAGAAPHFDAVAAQPYGFGLAPDDPRSRRAVLNFRRVGWLRRVMVAEGDDAKPLWAVSYGWNRQPNDQWRTVTEAQQSRYVAQAAALARGWPWLAGLGWAIDRPPAPGDDPGWGFALYTPQGQPHPLWETFAQVNRSTDSLPGPSLSPLISSLLLWLIALLYVVWRGWRAAQTAGVGEWPGRWAGLPVGVKAAGWLVLALLYYFATWPPLIALCWLVAALFLAAQPLTGLVLIGLLLPFHYQHKEVALVGSVLAVPPAYALALCASLRPLCSLRPTQILQKLQTSTDFIRVNLPFPRHQRPIYTPDFLALGWVAISLLSALAAGQWQTAGMDLWWLVVGPLLLYLLARLFATSHNSRQWIAGGMAGGGILAGLIALFLWWRGAGTAADGTLRLVGLTFSPNQTALLLLRLLFVNLGLILATGGLARRLWLAGAGVMGVALLLTASRGALLLGVPAGVAFLLFLRPTIRQWLLRRGWLVIPGSLAALALLLLLLGERIVNSATVTQRLRIWQGSLDLWQSAPWLGPGPGGFFWRYPAFLTPGALTEPNLLHPHNLWLEFATGWGLLGLVWLAGLLYWLFQRGRQKGRALDGMELGLLAGLVAGLAHAQVDAFGALPELAAWNWLALGLLGAGAWDERRRG